MVFTLLSFEQQQQNSSIYLFAITLSTLLQLANIQIKDCFSSFPEGRLTMLLPKENKEDGSEIHSAVAVDEGRLEPRSDDEDT